LKRSVWKVPFVSPCFFSQNFFEEAKEIKTFCRSSLITDFFLKKKVLIYSGKSWVKLLVQKPMIGLKLGEFSITKIMGKAISASMAKKNKEKIRSKNVKK
jgi:ribosomal protein S19